MRCLRYLRQLRRQDGISLVMAIGILGVLSISSTTLVYYSTSNARSAEFSKENASAYDLAEAGINEMVAILHKPGPGPIDPGLLPATTSTYDNGSVTWSGTFEAATWTWSLTATGLIKNPTGAGAADVRRVLTAKVPVYPVNTQPLAVDAWNFVYSWGTGDPDGCDMLVNANVDVRTRLMAAGNLCWANGSKQSAGELIVGGTNTVNGTAAIGSSAAPISRMDANGCRVSTGTLHDPCQGPPTHADKVWATTITSDPGVLAPPGVDLDGWYANASPGPLHPCEISSGSPPVFENEVSPKLRNRSVPGSFNLTPASSYTCKTMAGVNPLGELSWNNTTKVLTIRGTIFIDGNAYVSQSSTYDGQATLYLSGSFLINQAKFCAVKSGTSCDYSSGAWDPNTRLLTIVANGDGGQTGVAAGDSLAFSGNNVTEWQGAMYGGAYRVQLNAGIKAAGPIIADEVVLNSTVQEQGFSTISDVPTGMPGNPLVVAQPDKPQLYSD